jgi:hypothetical protein
LFKQTKARVWIVSILNFTEKKKFEENITFHPLCRHLNPEEIYKGSGGAQVN